MELKDVKTLTDIKQGDTIILTGDDMCNEVVKAQIVKVSKNDGTEIIFDKKMNKFFNLGMYLRCVSWVKECKVINIKTKTTREELTKKENLAIRIMLIRDKQNKGIITFNQAIESSIKMINDYEKENL